MSRAFHPPDTLSKEDVRKIADVRRDVWTSGFKGLFYGAATGYTLHTASRFIHDKFLTETMQSKIRTVLNKKSKSNPVFSRNTAFLSFMAGGALGSFLMATTTGKNEIHELHDIFHINEKIKDDRTTYQKLVETGKEVDDDENLGTKQKRRLSRRKTVAKRLEKGQGLSDSHGGHWLDEAKTSVTQEQRTIRRRALTKRLEEGKGLSDSHSGKWQP